MLVRRGFFSVLVVAVTCLLATPGTLLAQTTPPAVVPDPAECTVEPRDAASLAAIAGTPEPASSVQTEADLPQGPAVDTETLAEIAAAERLLIACLNAGSFAHVLALSTDHAAVEFLAGPPSQALIDRILSPATPAAAAERVSLIIVRDARSLGKDRVGAIVEWGTASAPDVITQVIYHAFVKIEDHWLLDEEIANLPVPPAASPSA
jgi:hypothetical protein